MHLDYCLVHSAQDRHRRVLRPGGSGLGVFGEIGPHLLHVLAERHLEGGRVRRSGQVAENERDCFGFDVLSKRFLKREG